MNQVEILYLIRLLIASGDGQVGDYALRSAADQLVDEKVNSLGVLEFCRKKGWTNLSDSDARSLIRDWEVSQIAQMVEDSADDTVDAAADAELVRTAPNKLKEIGSYTIDSLAGRGGFGSVYRARHKDLPGPTYAVKVLDQFEENPGALERFKKEAGVNRLIQHNNCVIIFEVQLEHDPPYMVFEFLDGDHFDTVVQSMLRKGRLAGCMRLFRDVCNGVSAYHRAGIVHRDLKPPNVMVVVAHGMERPVVLDPMPKSMAADSEDGSVFGTPHFMAPEQITNEEPVSPATDVYSLGATMYTALTGEPVHDGSSSMDIMSKASKEKGVPKHVASQLRKAINNKAHANRIIPIISKCLERAPSKRYRDASELVKAVNSYLDFVRDEGRRQERKRRQMFWQLVAALVLSVVGGSFVYERTNQDRLSKAEDARQARQARDEEKKRADAEAKRAEAETDRAEAELKAGLAWKGQAETEKRATELAEIRALTESEARKKVEALLEQLRDKNTAAEGLLKSQEAIKSWRWQEASEILKAILKLEPDSYRIRELLALVLFNLKEAYCVEVYRWLASKHIPDTPESKKIRWEFQLKAMIALLDFPLVKPNGKLADASTKLAIVTEISKDFTEEPYISIGMILKQDAKEGFLRASHKTDEADREARIAGKIAMKLYEKSLDSALVKYVVAIHLEPVFLNRNLAMRLLDKVAEAIDDFLPVFMARQRNCLFVVSQFGIEYERSEALLRTAQKDLLKLRKRLPCTTKIDMAYIDCLVTMTRMHVFRDDRNSMIAEACQEAESYLKLRGTERYRKNAYLIELTIAYAFAAKYQWAKANHKAGTSQLRKLGLTALKKAKEQGSKSNDPRLIKHSTKRESLISSWLQ